MLKASICKRVISAVSCGLALLLLLGHTCTAAQTRADRNPEIPAKPAVAAILGLFSTYEVVGLEAGHGEKDVDDFILSLIRNPQLPNQVNDIVVECGNKRYQPILDRYVAGENVPFSEVQHVWRDTTQAMCGESGFYEQLFPLVRSINKGLPAAKRLRVLAADPPIDWEKVQRLEDTRPFLDRDGSIAAVMESEVLSKHRKALMLFGIFHLLHGSGLGQGDAVTRYERQYPGKTFVVSGLGYYGLSGEQLPIPQAALQTPPLLLDARKSSLSSMSLGTFLPTLPTIDQNCNVVDLAKSQVRSLLDAFLYLGPQNFLLNEPVPADIALDQVYRAEWLRRQRVSGMIDQQTLADINKETVESAATPIWALPRNPPPPQDMMVRWRQGCLERKLKSADQAK